MKPVADDCMVEEMKGIIVHQEQRTELELFRMEFSRLFVVDDDDDGVVEKSWSQLPDELLCLIFSRIFAGDRFAFRSVCRSWRSVSVFSTQHCQLIPLDGNLSRLHAPCLIFSNRKVFHPIDSGIGYVDSIIRVAKDGWLLITEGVYGIFFFNPLTKEEVRLPNLPETDPYSMYFSSPPTSTNWFVIAANIIDFTINIYTIRYGEERWSSCEFTKINWSFRFLVRNPLVHKGLYYFLGEDAKLLIHDPLRQTFYLHEAPKSMRLQATDGDQYILESDGKILAVFVGREGSWMRVCQWNLSKKTWETLESLGGKMLFVSRALSVCLGASVRGSGNKIYFPRFVNGHCLFYSMSTKRYHTFANGDSFKSFHGSKSYRHSTWFL